MKVQPLIIEVTNEEVRKALEQKIRDTFAYDNRVPKWGAIASMTANDAGTGFIVRWIEEEPETKIEAVA